jgi:hypothetical protein
LPIRFKGRKATLLSVLFFLTSFFYVYSESAPQKKFELKLSGGICRLSGTDYEAVSDGWNYLQNIAAEDAGATFSSERNSFDWGWETNGELVFNLSSQFALSGGVGYISGKFSNMRMSTLDSVTTSSSEIDLKAKAIPLTAGIYYFLPLSSNSQLSLGTGIGYYFSSFSSSSFRENNTPYRQDTESTGSGGGIGFHGGIGFEYALSETVAIVIEGYGRYAKISGFEGTRNQSDTNNVNTSAEGTYYTHERLVWSGDWLTRVSLSTEPPSGADIRNVRDYEIDFSGFAIKVGLKIKLF